MKKLIRTLTTSQNFDYGNVMEIFEKDGMFVVNDNYQQELEKFPTLQRAEVNYFYRFNEILRDRKFKDLTDTILSE